MLHQVIIGMKNAVLGMLLIVLFACGTDEGLPSADCLISSDGVLISSPCESPGISPDPTPTAAVLASGASSSGGTEGAQVFLRTGCAACHAIDNSQATGQVGPNLTFVGAKGESYLRESILQPNAVIAEDCPGAPCQPDIMPQNFTDVLSDAEIEGLLTYLSSLK